MSVRLGPRKFYGSGSRRGHSPALQHPRQRAARNLEYARRAFAIAVRRGQHRQDVLASRLPRGNHLGGRSVRALRNNRCGVGLECGPHFLRRCSGPITSCAASTRARSSTFSSSRTLPGQSYASRARCASGSTATGPRSWRAPNRRRKSSIRRGMSCRRSRSGASVIVTTLSR